MASADKIVKTVQVEKVVLVDQEELLGVELSLSNEEARALREVLARVGGGDPRRGLCRNIADALTDAGFPYAGPSDIQGYIHFGKP